MRAHATPSWVFFCTATPVRPSLLAALRNQARAPLRGRCGRARSPCSALHALHPSGLSPLNPVDASAPARADPWLFHCAACPPTPISAGSLRALWLEGNGFTKIEGLDTLSELRCLYAHQNCLSKIENLNCCPLLASLQLSNNHILTISNISHLSQLQTLRSPTIT